MKQLNLMAFTGMVINIVLNIVLIPKFHAVGSAYASLITQVFTGLTQLILALLIFKIKPDIRFIFQLLMFVGIVSVLGTLSQKIDNWIYGYLGLILASLFFAVLLKLFNLKDLYKIIWYER